MITDITTSQSLVRGGKVLPVAQIVRSFYYFNVRKAAGVRMSEITTLRTTSEKKSVPHYQISMYPHSFYQGYAIIVSILPRRSQRSASAVVEKTNGLAGP